MRLEKLFPHTIAALLAMFYLQGCEGSLIQEGYRDVTAPYCDGLHEIQGIEKAWLANDQSVHLCVVGIPVGRVADKPPARELWKEKKYSVTLPADILHRPTWIAEAGPDDIVAVPAENIVPECTSPAPDSQEIPIVHWGGTDTMETSPEPVHLAVIDMYNRTSNAKEYLTDSGTDQTVILRRTVNGGPLFTYRHYRLQRSHGEPPPDMVGFAVAALIVDSAALLLGGDGLLKGESEPTSCLLD